MRRLFWVTMGATAGVLVMRKVSTTAKAYSPEGVAEGLSGLGQGLRELAAAVAASMAERDAELRLALGIDESAAGAGMDATTAQSLIDNPTAPRVDDPRP